MKDIYQHPTISSLATALTPAATPSPVEESLAGVLAGALGVESVSVDGHFFDDLGADSLVMAQFCARVRKRQDLPSISMKDIYQHPTISSLAAALVPADAAVPQTTSSVPDSREVPAPVLEAPARASSLEYVLCGTLQVLILPGVFLCRRRGARSRV